MKIFDFLSKLIFDKKESAEAPAKEKIPPSELRSRIEKDRKKIESREDEIFHIIKHKVNTLSEEIVQKIDAAKSFDVNSKKAEERLKSASEEGRRKYIEFVESLISNLNGLEKDNLMKMISRIDLAFSDFSKKSHKNYERATILVGKEMRDIRETLKKFSKEIMETFEQNKNIIESSGAISEIESNLKQLEKTENELRKTREEMDYIKKGITDKEKENKETSEEIEKIKKSKSYSEIEEKNEKLKTLRNNLEKEISELKRDIDFKALGNFYHIFEDKMKIVKLHREDFHTNFQRDNGKTILSLLEGSKLLNNTVSEKIESLQKKKEKILNLKKLIAGEETPRILDELYSKNSKITSEIENLNVRKTREEKRFEGLNKDKEKILNEMKINAEKLNIEI